MKCNSTRRRAIRASALRRVNLQRDADGFEHFPGDEHAAARHVVFFTSSPQSYTGAFNAAEEAKVCCRRENYGRNPDGSPARSMRDHAGGQFVNTQLDMATECCRAPAIEASWEVTFLRCFAAERPAP